MTAELTPEQAAKLAEIEAAPAAEESLRERVARALCRHEFGAEFLFEQTPEWQQHLREAADAAIAVMRGPATEAERAEMTEAGELRTRLQFVEHDLEHVVRERDDATAALRRVLALAEDYERAADEAAAEAMVGQPSEAAEYYRRVKAAGYNAATRIRAAVAGEP